MEDQRPNEGKILQYQGPFEVNEKIRFWPTQAGDSQQSDNMLYKIGISIGEKDFMSFNETEVGRVNSHNIPIEINNERIQIGRTFIYEPGYPLRRLEINFPKGCPASTLIEVTTMSLDLE